MIFFQKVNKKLNVETRTTSGESPLVMVSQKGIIKFCLRLSIKLLMCLMNQM